jgi:hypothetical protein
MNQNDAIVIIKVNNGFIVKKKSEHGLMESLSDTKVFNNLGVENGILMMTGDTLVEFLQDHFPSE